MEKILKELSTHADDLSDVLESRIEILDHINSGEFSENSKQIMLKQIKTISTRYGCSSDVAMESSYGDSTMEYRIAMENVIVDAINKIIDGIKWIFNKIVSFFKKLFGLDNNSSSGSSGEDPAEKLRRNTEETLKWMKEMANRPVVDPEVDKMVDDALADIEEHLKERAKEEVKKNIKRNRHYRLKRENMVQKDMEFLSSLTSAEAVAKTEAFDAKFKKMEDVEKNYEAMMRDEKAYLQRAIDSVGGLAKYINNRFNNLKFAIDNVAGMLEDTLGYQKKFTEILSKDAAKEMYDGMGGSFRFKYLGADVKVSKMFAKDVSEAESKFNQIIVGMYGSQPSTLNDRIPSDLLGDFTREDDVRGAIYENIIGNYYLRGSVYTDNKFVTQPLSCKSILKKNTEIKKAIEERRKDYIRKHANSDKKKEVPREIDIKIIEELLEKMNEVSRDYKSEAEEYGKKITDKIEKLHTSIQQDIFRLAKKEDGTTDFGYVTMFNLEMVAVKDMTRLIGDISKQSYPAKALEATMLLLNDLTEYLKDFLKHSTFAKKGKFKS